MRQNAKGVRTKVLLLLKLGHVYCLDMILKLVLVSCCKCCQKIISKKNIETCSRNLCSDIDKMTRH